MLWRHAAAGPIVPGKSTWAPRKTTPQDGLKGLLHKCSGLDGADDIGVATIGARGPGPKHFFAFFKCKLISLCM